MQYRQRIRSIRKQWCLLFGPGGCQTLSGSGSVKLRFRSFMSFQCTGVTCKQFSFPNCCCQSTRQMMDRRKTDLLEFYCNSSSFGQNRQPSTDWLNSITFCFGRLGSIKQYFICSNCQPEPDKTYLESFINYNPIMTVSVIIRSHTYNTQLYRHGRGMEYK